MFQKSPLKHFVLADFFVNRLVQRVMDERKCSIFFLYKAKNTVNALVLAMLFNAVQDKICRLQQFDGLLSKSNAQNSKPRQNKSFAKQKTPFEFGCSLHYKNNSAHFLD